MIKKIVLIYMLMFLAACNIALAASVADDEMEKGVGYCKTGLYDDAIVQFDKIIAQEPDNAEAYNNRGIAYLARVSLGRAQGKDFKNMVSDFNNANSDFDRAIKLKPDFVSAYYNRGLTNIAQHEKAIGDFSKVIELKPDHARAYYYRAVEYYNLKDYGQAWSDVHKAKELGYEVDSNFLSKLEKVSRDKKQNKK